MDAEARARRQSLRVIISEIIMVITVAVTVAVLVLLASGYWLNADFEVERQGMLQIRSIPTGATVSVDGDTSWFQRTNTSKVLSSGAHKVILSKDGYDSWQKNITITEGLLYRVNYPRLFLLERSPIAYYETANATSALVSPNHNFVLLSDDTMTYTVLRLNSEEPEAVSFDIRKLRDGRLADQSFAQILGASAPDFSWDKDNNLIATIDEKYYKINWKDGRFLAVQDEEKTEPEAELPGKVFYFYDSKYSADLNDNTIIIYKESQDQEVFLAENLAFVPENLRISTSGDFVFMESNTQVAVVDMELRSIIEWTLDSADYGWLDNGMLYAIKDGMLIVYDFDGQNRRELATGLTAGYPVTITDNKWLYYFSDGIIMRELIVR